MRQQATDSQNVTLTPKALGVLIGTILLSISGSIATTGVLGPHAPAAQTVQSAAPGQPQVQLIGADDIKRRLDNIESELSGFREFRANVAASDARIEQSLKDLKEFLRVPRSSQ